jgi:4-hydroxythreonine-4-phosphate dehydrogenase
MSSSSLTDVNIPRVAITMGESAGIGPELLVKLAQYQFDAELVVLADPNLLQSLASKLNLPLKLSAINWAEPASASPSGHLKFEAIHLIESAVAGELNLKNAVSCIESLDRASDLALQNKVGAIVTAPVHKAHLNKVAPEFLGHTEYFAERAEIDKVVMMLATQGLRVSLATTHLPLNQVAHAITPDLIQRVLEVMHNSFKRFGLDNLKIAVCGLNPHAGEDGLLGDEEQRVIIPVIQSLQLQGHQVFGPFPADTLFTQSNREKYDVFLAMFHDQGLPVIKALAFGQCANITLGLPYIRTSVDHGTALDIASDYKASVKSLRYAVDYAIQLINRQLPE